MKAIVSASSRVFSVFSTAPHIGTPKAASYIGGVFGAMTATVSFLPIPAPGQRRGQPAAAGIGLLPGVALRAMHDRQPVRIDVRRPLQKGQRRQRRVVRLVLRQSS